MGTAFGCAHKQSHIFAAAHIAIPCQQSFNATASISAIVIPSLHSCPFIPPPFLPPLPARPIIHSSCTKIAFTCHFNRIFVAVVACKAFSFVFLVIFFFFLFSFFLFLLLLLLLCTMFCFAVAKTTTKYYCNFFVDFRLKEGVWRGRTGGGGVYGLLLLLAPSCLLCFPIILAYSS